jgi:hypothetical protein
MNKTSTATLSTGLVGAWFCSIFAMTTGVLWLQVGAKPGDITLYNSNTFGYVLVLAGLLAIAPLSFATTAAWFGHEEAARRITRIVKCSVVSGIVFGWLASKMLLLLTYYGAI